MIVDANQREKTFVNWLKENKAKKTTLNSYPKSLRETIPKKLQDINEFTYSNLFECLDINYLEDLYSRLLSKGDLYDFNKSVSNGVPSAATAKYKDFLIEHNLDTKNIDKEEIKDKENIYAKVSIGNLTFLHKNLLLKGVPGTGKSRAIENIINNKLELQDHKENILRINIHSASSNADLMQGIGISSNDGQIEYKEKQGLILNLIEKATYHPKQPFVLILEEIQENSLNELIGDLIYLIEEDKRAKNIIAYDEEYEYQELVEKIVADNPETAYVEIPYLVNDSTEYRKMIMPNNLYIFCTSNYRDDKKVIEDNLLRRFEVLEIYPKYKVTIGEAFKNQGVSDFLERLNNNILNVLKDEMHPDRFLIGHSNWLSVDSEEEFFRAFLKVVVEFKDIKEIDFVDFKTILDKDIYTLPQWLGTLEHKSYKELIEYVQSKAGYDFLD